MGTGPMGLCGVPLSTSGRVPTGLCWPSLAVRECARGLWACLWVSGSPCLRICVVSVHLYGFVCLSPTSFCPSFSVAGADQGFLPWVGGRGCSGARVKPRAPNLGQCSLWRETG